MRKIAKIFLAVIILSTSGCGTFFKKQITDDNLRSTVEATEIETRSNTIKNRAETIQEAALAGRANIRQGVKSNEISLVLADENSSRYNRIGEEALLIEKLARLNVKSSSRIVSINMGTWYTTVWFKVLIGGIICFGLLLLISYVTFILRSWGVLSYIKTINEGVADGVADIIDVNKDIDNDQVNDEINKRIRRRKTR